MASNYVVSPRTGVIIYTTLSTFPASTVRGDLGVAADSNMLYEFDGTTWNPVSGGGGGGGTVTTVSVASANGLAGTVANPTTTPVITLSTSVTGILEGDGTTIGAAPTTGSGSVVLATSPALVTPNLGTPSAVALTNASGVLPVGVTGGSGLSIAASQLTSTTGTGNVVLATSPVLVTPNLGTPSAVALTNASGVLPVGVTGGSGLSIAASQLTSTTGTGNVVLATSPVLVTPNLGTPSAVALTNASGVLPVGVTGGSGLNIAITQLTGSEPANTVFAGPTSGGSTTPTFRALVASDIPGLSSTYVTQSEVGTANGVASLDSGGKVPVSQLPSTVMLYLGAWDASTNTPTLADGTGVNGDLYRVSVAGTQNLGSGPQTFFVGDFIIYNGTIWQRSPAADGVISVNGASGAVTVNAINQLTGDVTAGPASGSASAAASLVATTNATLATLSALTTASSLASVGTLTSGTWAGTTIAVNHGGTGATTSTGSGSVVLSNSPTLVTPALGTPSAIALTNASGVLPVGVTGGSGLSIDASQLTSTTGSGNAVLATSPTLVTPNLGTPSTLVGTNITGTASGFTAGTVTTNANLTGVITSVGNATSTGAQTGTGNTFVMQTSPSLVTPNLGTPSAVALTNASGVLPVGVTGGSGLSIAASQLTSTTGTGNVVLATSPVLVTPNLDTPSTLVGTNITGTASGFTAGTVTTNANLTGVITSVGNATSIASQTGTGTKFVVDTSPTLVTPNLGTPTSGNLSNCTGVSLTSGVTGILPIANGGTNASLTLAAGGVIYSTASGLAVSVAGSSGQVLVSGGTGAPTWSSAATNPMTTVGDTIYGGTGGAETRLAGVTAAALSVLTQTGTGSASQAPVWTASTGTGNVVLSASPTLTGTLTIADLLSSGRSAFIGGALSNSSCISVMGTAPATITSTTQIGLNSQLTANASGTSRLCAVEGKVTSGAAVALAESFDSVVPAATGGAITTFIDYIAGGAASHIATNNAAVADNTTFTGNWFINQSGTDASTLGGALTVGGALTASSGTAATNNATGALIVTGGVGISGALYTHSNTLDNGSGNASIAGTTTVTGGIVGVATNSNATAGNVGEFVSANPGSPVTPGSSAAVFNVTSISLTAGDWDVEGTFQYSIAASTVATSVIAGISTSSSSFDSNNSGGYYVNSVVTGNLPAATILTVPVGRRRISLSGTSTIYLNSSYTYATLSSASVGVQSFIEARRVR